MINDIQLFYWQSSDFSDQVTPKPKRLETGPSNQKRCIDIKIIGILHIEY
jgi:hypothetical protein